MKQNNNLKIETMQYKVVPFVASLDPKKRSSSDVAQQLESVISIHEGQGWKYVRLESVTTFINPDMGCFGIGAKPGYNTTYQMVVFEKA